MLPRSRVSGAHNPSPQGAERAPAMRAQARESLTDADSLRGISGLKTHGSIVPNAADGFERCVRLFAASGEFHGGGSAAGAIELAVWCRWRGNRAAIPSKLNSCAAGFAARGNSARVTACVRCAFERSESPCRMSDLPVRKIRDSARSGSRGASDRRLGATICRGIAVRPRG